MSGLGVCRVGALFSHMLSNHQPVGIFDSGIGGLTVANAIRKRMPNESLIYFGDTAHLPYGDKSEAAIQAYSIRIADFLLQQGCKVLVIACNSASSAAYDLLKEYVRKDVQVINVIDPMVAWVSRHYAHQKTGLIGTKRTVQSGIYKRKLLELNPAVELHSLATPLLAPMIEEGYHHNKISHDLIEEYLTKPELAHISALILACTHYPLIKDEIATYYKSRVAVLDSSELVADALFQHLQSNNLRSTAVVPTHRFYVSDYTEAFEAATRIFFGEQIQLQQQKL
jgi:glutamate racemase